MLIGLFLKLQYEVFYTGKKKQEKKLKGNVHRLSPKLCSCSFSFYFLFLNAFLIDSHFTISHEKWEKNNEVLKLTVKFSLEKPVRLPPALRRPWHLETIENKTKTKKTQKRLLPFSKTKHMQQTINVCSGEMVTSCYIKGLKNTLCSTQFIQVCLGIEVTICAWLLPLAEGKTWFSHLCGRWWVCSWAPGVHWSYAPILPAKWDIVPSAPWWLHYKETAPWSWGNILVVKLADTYFSFKRVHRHFKTAKKTRTIISSPRNMLKETRGRPPLSPYILSQDVPETWWFSTYGSWHLWVAYQIFCI